MLEMTIYLLFALVALQTAAIVVLALRMAPAPTPVKAKPEPAAIPARQPVAFHGLQGTQVVRPEVKS